MNIRPNVYTRLSLLLAGQVLCMNAGAASQSGSGPDTSRVVRRDLTRGNFVGALQTLEKVGSADIGKDPELLTLRGLAQWGQALRNFEGLASIATEFEMVRTAKY